MVADVPVGVFLSGGIDSSAVVAALTSQGHALRTFAVVFGERDYDESRHSQLVARQFGTDHVELFLRPEHVLEEFDEAVGAYDQPSMDGLNTYFIAQATRQAGVKVALSGIGGDELFAGYSSFRRLARLERLPRGVAWLLHQAMRRVAPQSIRTTKLGALLRKDGSRLARYAISREVMAAGRRQALFSCVASSSLSLPAEVAAELDAVAGHLDPINAHSLFELSLYMANMLLRDTDQMSMAHALEVRDPLLDHVLVDTVAGLPGALKLAAGRQSRVKSLLIDALPVDLPLQVVRRQKMGFVFPWEHWLRNELRDRIEATLTDLPTLKAAQLNPEAVRTLWQAYLARRPGLRYTDVLCLVHLLHWVRQHRLTFQDVPTADAPVGLAYS
jgi:asparagine synthase (glutamine-hydrolysing)